MTDGAVRPLGLRWLWLALPLVTSSLPWASAHGIDRATNGVELEAAYAGAFGAEILGVVVTGLVSVVLLRGLGVVARMDVTRYVLTIVAVAIPAFVSLFPEGLAVVPVLILYVVVTRGTYSFARGGVASPKSMILATSIAMVGALAILSMAL